MTFSQGACMCTICIYIATIHTYKSIPVIGQVATKLDQLDLLNYNVKHLSEVLG